MEEKKNNDTYRLKQLILNQNQSNNGKNEKEIPKKFQKENKNMKINSKIFLIEKPQNLSLNENIKIKQEDIPAFQTTPFSLLLPLPRRPPPSLSPLPLFLHPFLPPLSLLSSPSPLLPLRKSV